MLGAVVLLGRGRGRRVRISFGFLHWFWSSAERSLAYLFKAEGLGASRGMTGSL